MPVLARKVTRAKWVRKEGLADDEVPADAVTVDLRTTNNELSFWTSAEPGPEKAELREVVLALAAAAERPDRVELVWVSETAVSDAGLQSFPTEGATPVVTLRGRHLDIRGLDYVRLGKVADLVADALQQEHHHALTWKEVAAILVDAVENKIVDLADLQEKVRTKVEQAMKKENGSGGDR